MRAHPLINRKNLQIHVEVENDQYKRFRAAIKKLGYKTVSAFVREKIRNVIKEAEEDG